MADSLPMPRSGVWHLRSKIDPRWNCQGQYGSLLSDEPLATPTEAHQACEALKISLRAEPPDDMQWVALPYPSPQFRRLFDFHVFAVTERQVDLHKLTLESGLGQLSIDFTRAEISLGRPGSEPQYRLPAQFLGFLDREQSCWQWGWMAQEKGSLNPAALRSAAVLREYGQAHEIPELTYSEIWLGTADDRPWFNADYLAVVSAHLCKAGFYTSGPVPDAPELLMYWLVSAPEVPQCPLSPARRMATGISQAMAAWAEALAGSDGRAIISAYAEQRNCRVSAEGPRRVRIDEPSGGYLHVDFDESGHIAGLELPAEQTEPAKPSWLNRLIGRK
jgi:uncharacterized protein DUF6882